MDTRILKKGKRVAYLWAGAVDCSFNNCGWCILKRDSTNSNTTIADAGIIDNSATISPKNGKSLDDLLRCSELFNKIGEDFSLKYLSITGPKVLSAEIPGGSQSSRAASCLGMARGVLGSVIATVIGCEHKKHSVVLVKPTEVHKKATGNIKATKNEIIDYVCNKFKDQIVVSRGKNMTTYTITIGKTALAFNKGEFEHIADSIVMAELGLDKEQK